MLSMEKFTTFREVTWTWCLTKWWPNIKKKLYFLLFLHFNLRPPSFTWLDELQISTKTDNTSAMWIASRLAGMPGMWTEKLLTELQATLCEKMCATTAVAAGWKPCVLHIDCSGTICACHVPSNVLFDVLDASVVVQQRSFSCLRRSPALFISTS